MEKENNKIIDALSFIKRKLFVEDFSLRTQLIFVSILMIDKWYLWKLFISSDKSFNTMAVYTSLYIYLGLVLYSPLSDKARLVRGILLIILLFSAIFTAIIGSVSYGSILHLITGVISYICYILITLFLIFERKNLKNKNFAKKSVIVVVSALVILYSPLVILPVLTTGLGIISDIVLAGTVLVFVFLVFVTSIQYTFNSYKVTATVLLVPVIVYYAKYTIVNTELYKLMQYM